MSFVAGIVRHDHLAVPDEWISSLAGSRAEPLETLRFGEHAVFLSSHDNWKRGGDESLLLCDARLDEREVLAKALGLDSTGARDIDLIAESLNRHGTAATDALVGDFALVSWETALRRLRISRSHLGTRPLFYVTHGGIFAFASTLPALLALSFVSQALDDAALCRMLCFDGTGPPDETYYAEIRRVPAGHSLSLENGAHSLAALAPPWSGASAPRISGGTVAQTLRALLVDTVETRLRGGEKIAVHLSGGLDSSTIACIAARRLKQEGRRLLALCSVLPAGHVGPESDERRFIEAVLAQESNIDPVWIELPPDTDPFGALPRWFECLGEPSYSNVTHAEEKLGEIGRKHGADVVLSGFGGDFFVSARGMPTAQLRLWRGQPGKAVAELRRLHRTGGTPWWRLALDHVVRPLAGLRFHLLDRRWTGYGCAAPALRRRVERQDGRRPAPSASGKVRDLPHEQMDFVLQPGHLERVLPGICQLFVEEFDQDLRFPLLDTRLIAFVRSLPEEELHHDGRPRDLMRRATAGILPEVIRLRPDKGPAFDPAIAEHCAAARPALRQWAETAPPICWNYVDRPRFLAALDTIAPTDRAGWLSQMFSVVLTGGRIAKFVEWHAGREGGARH